MLTFDDEEKLRDEFAMIVLKGMHPNAIGIHSFGEVKSDEFIKLLADTAYRIADAMMERRRR